jgi:hypothetical protein
MPALHELSNKEMRGKLSSGELSDKKATVARALLRRRRQERLQAWLKRHVWLGAILGAIGLAGIFSISKAVLRTNPKDDGANAQTIFTTRRLGPFRSFRRRACFRELVDCSLL